jgi:hypothetical protein
VNQEFWPWWQAGLWVGTVATLYPLVSGRLLGVSSLYALLFQRRRATWASSDELEQALLVETEAEFGRDSAPSPESQSAAALGELRTDSEKFRPLFLLGMIGGAALTGLGSSGWRVSFSLGERFDARYGELSAVPIAILFIGGFAIGLGARLGAGCTSGHGISGVARGQRGSLLTAFVFWVTALAVTWLFVLAGGAT